MASEIDPADGDPHQPTRTGGRALVLGLLSWLLVGAVSYAGVSLLGR